MHESNSFESFSIIEKEEFVQNLEYNVIPSSFVLEITHPFPGYYGNDFITSQSQPNTLFFVLKDFMKFEDFYRIVKRIKKYSEFNFDAALSEIFIHNQLYNAIRIRNLSNYKEAGLLQSCFFDEGVIMAKSKKIQEMALIRISKVIHLHKLNTLIFREIENPEFTYFEIPEKVGWKHFEQITKKIKNSYPDFRFDAATGVLFLKEGLADVVRLYKSEHNEENLKKLLSLYLAELNT